jgi:hypothetical protein
MGDITWHPGGGLIGWAGEEGGALIAFRENCTEGLFASRDKKPLRWIAIEAFTVDPASIVEIVDEEDDDGGDDNGYGGAEPHPTGPFGRRRRTEPESP